MHGDELSVKTNTVRNEKTNHFHNYSLLKYKDG